MKTEAENNVTKEVIRRYEEDIKGLESDIRIYKGAIRRLKECMKGQSEEPNSLIDQDKYGNIIS